MTHPPTCTLCGGHWRSHTHLYQTWPDPHSVLCATCSQLVQHLNGVIYAKDAGLPLEPVRTRISCPHCGSDVWIMAPDSAHTKTYGSCTCHLTWLRAVAERHPELMGAMGPARLEEVPSPSAPSFQDDRILALPGCPPVNLSDFLQWATQALYAAAAVTARKQIPWRALTIDELCEAAAQWTQTQGPLATTSERDEWVRELCLLAIVCGTKDVEPLT